MISGVGGVHCGPPPRVSRGAPSATKPHIDIGLRPRRGQASLVWSTGGRQRRRSARPSSKLLSSRSASFQSFFPTIASAGPKHAHAFWLKPVLTTMRAWTAFNAALKECVRASAPMLFLELLDFSATSRFKESQMGISMAHGPRGWFSTASTARSSPGRTRTRRAQLPCG